MYGKTRKQIRSNKQRTRFFSEKIQSTVSVLIEGGLMANDSRLHKTFESCFELEVLAFYEREMSIFAAHEIYLNMSKLNAFLGHQHGHGQDFFNFFDCSLVTRDSKAYVKRIQIDVESPELFVKKVPKNLQLVKIVVEKVLRCQVART